MSIGSMARETRSTSRRTPSSRTMTSSGRQALDGLALVVDGADEERALATARLGVRTRAWPDHDGEDDCNGQRQRQPA